LRFCRWGFGRECNPLKGELSEVHELLEQGERFSFESFALLGNGEDRFLEAKGRIVGGLRATERIAKDIPAADRTVSLDHNSQSYREAVERLEELTRSVRHLNDIRIRRTKSKGLRS
jgi:hypothetical protein